MISQKVRNCLALHVVLRDSMTKDYTPQAIQDRFTRAAEIIALVWPRNPYYRQYFDVANPLLHLSASVANGAQFVGTIGPVSRETPLELVCDFKQVSAASDGSLYISTVYPCRKITQDADTINTTEPNQGAASKATRTTRKKWQRQGGKFAFHKM
jgi:hypothetical protein